MRQNPICALSRRSIISAMDAPRSGGCFHSYSRRGANRSERSGTTSGYAPDAFATTRGEGGREGERASERARGRGEGGGMEADAGSSVILKRGRASLRERDAAASRPATTRDLWGFARIYVCPGRRVWLPRPHPWCGTEPGRRIRPTFPFGSTGDPSS